jgi:hypothetical protein
MHPGEGALRVLARPVHTSLTPPLLVTARIVSWFHKGIPCLGDTYCSAFWTLLIAQCLLYRSIACWRNLRLALSVYILLCIWCHSLY